MTHAAVTRGARYAAALLLVTAGVGFAAEVLGMATGWPFGHYRYASSLGPRVAGVPLIIPLAWDMMAYPALLVGRRIGVPVLGGTLALASWDLFLDPQMVDAGHWRFTARGTRLNGIPLDEHARLVRVSLVIMLLLVRVPERRDRMPRPTTASRSASTSGHTPPRCFAAAAFFGRPGVAVAGGLTMGIPAALLARTRFGADGRLPRRELRFEAAPALQRRTARSVAIALRCTPSSTAACFADRRRADEETLAGERISVLLPLARRGPSRDAVPAVARLPGGSIGCARRVSRTG